MSCYVILCNTEIKSYQNKRAHVSKMPCEEKTTLFSMHTARWITESIIIVNSRNMTLKKNFYALPSPAPLCITLLLLTCLKWIVTFSCYVLSLHAETCEIMSECRLIRMVKKLDNLKTTFDNTQGSFCFKVSW